MLCPCQVKYNIVQHVYPEIKNLYHFLEVEFHPLKLSGRVTVLLDFLNTKTDLAPYVSALQDITITRLLKQVSAWSAPVLLDLLFYPFGH